MAEITPQDKLTDLKSTFSAARKILILIKKEPSFDGLAAALALYLAIKKTGKSVDIYCETPVIVENASLIAIDKIKKDSGNKNLIIAFDYIDGAIERVSYNIEGNKFNLVITPKNGSPSINPEKVSYSYSGLSADLIFCLETQNLADLGKISEKEKEFFEKAQIVNINYRNNSSFAKYNVNTPGVLSCSELVLSLFQPLGFLIDPDIATNVLMGIEYASGSFSDPRLDATTFETVAYLLRQGAKRQKVPTGKPVVMRKTEEVKSTSASVAIERKPKTSPPPVDWLQPKIYKGGQLL